MDETVPWRPTSARLKLFLAKQAEGRSSRVGHQRLTIITEQQAAILTTLAVMKDYGGKMQNNEIAVLLNMIPSGVTNVLRGAMTTHGFVVKKDGYYEVTEKGIEKLEQFVDYVLGTPEAVERRLRANEPYRELLELVSRELESDLVVKFSNARLKASRHT